jgi:hypothetical protein
VALFEAGANIDADYWQNDHNIGTTEAAKSVCWHVRLPQALAEPLTEKYQNKHALFSTRAESAVLAEDV